MSQFPEFKYFVQPALFEYGETITGKLELLPQMWYVAEALASPSSANRRAALEFIYEQQVAKFSPLISYLLMTRIDEPDINMRQDIISLLADVLQPDNDGITATDQVRIVLYESFSQLDQNKILSILKTAETDPLLEPQVEVLLGASANAGDHLSQILLDREQPLEIRELAVKYIGRVGFLDAEPALKRIAHRLEAKFDGQQIMPFSRLDHKDELLLLPAIKSALYYLQAI